MRTASKLHKTHVPALLEYREHYHLHIIVKTTCQFPVEPFLKLPLQGIAEIKVRLRKKIQGKENRETEDLRVNTVTFRERKAIPSIKILRKNYWQIETLSIRRDLKYMKL